MANTKKDWECEKCEQCGLPIREHCKREPCTCTGEAICSCQPTTKTGEWRKELEKLAVEMPDGFYKDCKFYHEVVKHFIADLVSRERQQLIKEILEGRPKEANQPHRYDRGYNHCLEDYDSFIKSKLTEEAMTNDWDTVKNQIRQYAFFWHEFKDERDRLLKGFGHKVSELTTEQKVEQFMESLESCMESTRQQLIWEILEGVEGIKQERYLSWSDTTRIAIIKLIKSKLTEE